MTMLRVVPAAGAAISGSSADGLKAGLVEFLRSLGFVEDPATAPTHGVHHCASDYMAYGASALAGIALGYVAVHELGKLVSSTCSDRVSSH